MYLCFFCIYVYMCMYMSMYMSVFVYIILNNSALKFSRGRGHEARPWKSILQSLHNIFRYIQKQPRSCTCVWTKSFVCHALCL